MAERAGGATRSELLIYGAVILFLHFSPCAASIGDRDNIYRECVGHCEKGGCIDDACFSPCSGNAAIGDGKQQKLRDFTKWDCPSECRYQCMVKREIRRSSDGEAPVKYFGKWPFERLYGIQEPASVAFSLINMLAHIWGLSLFVNTVYRKLPTRTQGGTGPYYEFSGFWILYGLLSINSWLWSAVFHTRDIPVTERIDYSAANASLGYSLILSLVRVFSIRREEQQVMIAAPIIGFVATHICYLNFYELDYGWNMKVGVATGAAQLLLWFFWAIFTRHPSKVKICTVVLGTAAALLLEIFDFPPIFGHFDAHSLWHLVTIPLTCLWWTFVKEDAVSRTMAMVRPRKAE